MNTTGDNVAHLAHLGGMLFGFFMIRYWQKHPGENYNNNGGRQFFDNLRNSWERRKNKKAEESNSRTQTSGNSHATDWDYNARQRANQDEIDRILDKIRKSGYDSLTNEEKRKLFDQSNRR